METTIYVRMPAYLGQWLIHEMGGEPVSLPKSSPESKIIQVFATRPPTDYVPRPQQEGEVAIIMPQNKIHPPSTYSYLPHKAQGMLVRAVHNRMVIQLFEDLYQLRNLGQRTDHLIECWMQSHGIEYSGTAWDSLAKNYQRARNAFRMRQSRKQNSKKLSNLPTS